MNIKRKNKIKRLLNFGVQESESIWYGGIWTHDNLPYNMLNHGRKRNARFIQ